ncbi:cation-transporting ATPase, putative [Leishmania panamensis]|uniref:Cation-transporting ATPase, putative n=1 Tax=Leishmania panamensis TaxID=5679 RepID=A0A088RIJ3_LEIPA|nr:cation-transporting ATPase, putative [Leishmania panamensis]AIN95797.1 cation-transporting ATPase, putative [Leishmania panamensis]
MPTECIVENTMIRQLRLLQRREWYTWVTIWPFAVLYVVSAVLYLYPELIWDRVTYLVHQTYIDFFHAICFPVVLFLHSFLSLFTIWSVKFRARLIYRTVAMERLTEATDVLVETHLHKGESEIVPLHQESDDGHPPCFVFQQRKWKLDEREGIFVKPRFPTKHSFSYYMRWEGLNKEADCAKQVDTYGLNKMEVVIPEFQDLFVDHALSPFFVFQIFCVLLWCLDEYWYYSLFTGVMMVGMECTTVYQRIRNMRTLRDMAEVPVRDIDVMRGGKRVTIQTDALLPLDIIVVPSNAPCPVDAVLVKGTAVANEASLTGESTPQLKEAPDDVEVSLSVKKHARHMLFSGTQILLSNGPHTSSEEGGHNRDKSQALAVVLRTGFETKQGKLLRTILHSQGRVSENSGEAFGFIGVLVVFALAASGYLLKHGLADPHRSRWKLFLSCVQIITSVVPPELPMELSLAVNTTLLALTKLQVFCTEPFRIPYAGKVDTCCFDKTGTLTTDEMLFGGVDMVDGKGLLNKLKAIPKHAEMVLATCHSLVYLDEQTLAGDEMEKAAITALGYRIDGEDSIFHDPKSAKEKGTEEQVTKKKGAAEPQRMYKVLLRFPFLATLRRMACVVSAPDGKYIVAKGSPESIAALCESVPANCLKIAEETAAKGYRVIALAYRPLTDAERASKDTIRALRRDDVEEGLRFAGLAVYVCPLKKDAKETIENLTGGSHRCVIITGDSVQTAISVGKDVSMLLCKRQLVAKEKETGGGVEWADSVSGVVQSGTAKDILTNTFQRSRRKRTPHEDEWDLCVNAEAISPESMQHIIEMYNERVTIWARCAPTQKEEIVTDLKKKGHIVMMAGDGTNDVGALKQAHAGIAVLNSASVAPKAEKEVEIGPQPHSEPDLPAELKVPPNFKFTAVPPEPPAGTPFMQMMRWKVLEAKRKVEITQVTRWNQQLKDAEKAKADKKASASLLRSGPGESDFLMESLFNADDENMGGPPMIKLGDASIAAPFTCRSKALTSVCDIIRLGRTTLVTTHMMYKILALNCLTQAYSMSVLHCAGVKFGEKQMILAGIILSVCFLFMSRSKPLAHLCPQRPVTKVFHPYMICTVFFQFVLHLYCMMKTSWMVAEVDAATMSDMSKNYQDVEFKPTLLNSTMFLLTTLISGVTFAVNYRGEPFMQGIRKNRPMFIALIILSIVVLCFAFESSPEFNKEFEITAFPTEAFRTRFTQLLMLDALGCFVIEKASLMLFTDY